MKESAPFVPFVLGVNGSPYKNGITAELLEKTLEGCRKAGARTETVHLYDLRMESALGLYSKDPELEIRVNMPKDDLTAFYPTIVAADGLVLASPINWFSVTPRMQEFLVRLTPLENEGFLLQGKLAICIAASRENAGGRVNAVNAMVLPLIHMGVQISLYGAIWYPGGEYATLQGETSEWAEDDAPKAGHHMVRCITRNHEYPIPPTEWREEAG